MGEDREEMTLQVPAPVQREIKPVKKLADAYTDCCKNIIGLSLLQMAISFAILAIGISCYVQFKDESQVLFIAWICCPLYLIPSTANNKYP